MLELQTNWSYGITVLTKETHDLIIPKDHPTAIPKQE